MKIKLILNLCIQIMLLSSLSAKNIEGIVYVDLNKNLKMDSNEKGLMGAMVSNGSDVVKTDKSGRWKLVSGDSQTIFVIQPSGFKVPVDASMVPQHYQLLKSSVDFVEFPLWKDETASDEFEGLFFGDTQARGIKEVNYVMNDVVNECIDSKAKFGVALGDIVADDPELFDEISGGIGQIGVPWYYVFGNHDHNRDAIGNEGADATFVKNFGPTVYAYEFGKVSFISLNNVDYKKEGGYRAHFSDDQIQFVKQYVGMIPEENLVVLMMHIPIVACDNREEIFRVLEGRDHTLSVAGHTHKLANFFVDEEYGWKDNQPHHMFINGTVSGSWWCGIKDELGIPHATMNDGAPNGYAIIRFTGNTYSIRYKAARRPADYQMNIYLPDEIMLSALDTTDVLVNFFNGSEKSNVEMQIDKNGDWTKLAQTVARDPANMDMYALNELLEVQYDRTPLDERLGWKMDYPSKSNHFWTGELPSKLLAGTHLISVKAIDMYGNRFLAHRVFRVIAD